MPIPLHSPQSYRATLRARRVLASTLEEYALALPDDSAMPAHAGQFVTIEIPQPEEAPARRPYSFVHAPPVGSTTLREITLCVKILDGGIASEFLHAASIGNPVTVMGPFGHFRLQPHDGDRVFVATGTGIAPFIGFLEELVQQERPHSITMITGDRSEEQLLYTTEIAALGNALRALGGSFELIRCVSRPQGAWSGVTGRVTDVLAAAVHNPATTQVTLCGNPQMIEDATTLCATLGVPETQIVKEKFTSLGKVAAARKNAIDKEG